MRVSMLDRVLRSHLATSSVSGATGKIRVAGDPPGLQLSFFDMYRAQKPLLREGLASTSVVVQSEHRLVREMIDDANAVTKRPPMETAELISKIIANLGGIAVPIAVAYLSYSLTVIAAKDHRSENNTSEFLEYQKYLSEKSTAEKVAIISALRSVGTDPNIVNALLTVASNTDDKDTKSVLQGVVAQIATTATLDQSAKSENAAIGTQAKQVLEARWMVVIASRIDEEGADEAAQKANERFQGQGSKLHAVALPPANSPYWGVYVGNGVTLPEAHSLVQEAKSLGYSDAYLKRAPIQ